MKKNINKFNQDITNEGRYLYNSERLSSKFSNKRTSDAIKKIYDFKNKKILDIGCGDGTYTFELIKFGAKTVLGIDPANNAIKAAKLKSKEMNLSHRLKFQVGNIYNLEKKLVDKNFDCLILRGVLHHLPNAEKGIESVSYLAKTIVIMEPNGFNPVLKLIEKFSSYHIIHEEQSFIYSKIAKWITRNDYVIKEKKYINLVPLFCPDWFATLLKFLEPMIEKIPLLRVFLCGQIIITAEKKNVLIGAS